MPDFSEALGRPGEGVHFHVFGIAIFDLALALALAWILSDGTGASFAKWAAGVLLLGIVAHRIFGVRTAIDKALFP
jgi:hypothetical protein